MSGISVIKLCCHNGKPNQVNVDINRSPKHFMLNYLQIQLSKFFKVAGRSNATIDS